MCSCVMSAKNNDASVTRAVQALVQAGEVAVLWATHLVDEVAQADRLLVLNKGLIAFDGLPADLVAQSGASNLEQAFFNLCQQSVQKK